MPDGISFAEAMTPVAPQGLSFAEAMTPPPPAADPVTDSEGHLVDNPDAALKRGAAFVQSAWGRLSGTDRPPAPMDGAVGADTTDTVSSGLRNALAPAANTTYGSILPLAKDNTTGEVRLALPSMIRSPLIGLTQDFGEATINPETNALGITPEAASVTNFAATPLRFGGAALSVPTITARDVQARDGVGIMEAWNRAHAENTAAATAAVADIGKATDIDGAIAAAGKAAEAPGDAAPIADAAPPQAPASEGDLFAPQPGPPIPQSAGAAASRDTTTGLALFGRSLREAKGAEADKELADLMRTPQPNDARDIIPGAAQTRAEIELNPTVSREAKGLRQEFREGFNEHEKANNELYHTWIDDVAPPREQIAAVKDLREAKWQERERTVFGPDPNGQSVSTAPIVQHLADVFSDPIEKSNSYLKKAIQPFLDAVTDDNGQPIQIGAKELYGIRQEMGRKVKDMATDTDLAHVRGQFGDLMKVTDDAIVTGAPDYLAMLEEYRNYSRAINAAERLQDIKLKITNGSDRIITFGQLDRFMKTLWMERHGPNPYAPAKDIPQETWDKLMLLHERLARSASADELARTKGSDTTQLMMEMMRKGAIGTAHAVVGKLTGGLGNIAIPMITKQIDQSRALKRVGKHLNPDLSRYPTPGP